jgi:hypothetical protein
MNNLDNQNNQVSSNINLRQQLESLHEMLGSEITDFATDALRFGTHFSQEADQVLRTMSEVTAKLTVSLMEVKTFKYNLSQDEQADYDKIKSLVLVLGNFQDKINRIIKLSEQINKLNTQLKTSALDLTEDILITQQKFREVRSQINDYGFLSKNPRLALLLEKDAEDHDFARTNHIF